MKFEDRIGTASAITVVLAVTAFISFAYLDTDQITPNNLEQKFYSDLLTEAESNIEVTDVAEDKVTLNDFIGKECTENGEYASPTNRVEFVCIYGQWYLYHDESRNHYFKYRVNCETGEVISYIQTEDWRKPHWWCT